MRTKAKILEKHTQDEQKFPNERRFFISSVVAMMDEYAEAKNESLLKGIAEVRDSVQLLANSRGVNAETGIKLTRIRMDIDNLLETIKTT